MLTIEKLQEAWNAGELQARREFKLPDLEPREGAWPAYEAYAGQQAVQAASGLRDWLEGQTVFTTAYLSEWDYIEQNGHSRAT